MLNFKNISPSADFYSKLDKLEIKLNVLSKNVLYITYMEDKILKTLNKIDTDKGLQKQVDEYFEEDAEEKAEQVPEE